MVPEAAISASGRGPRPPRLRRRRLAPAGRTPSAAPSAADSARGSGWAGASPAGPSAVPAEGRRGPRKRRRLGIPADYDTGLRLAGRML